MEAAGSGVRVNAICPGTIVDTEMRTVADAGARKIGQPTADERGHLIPLGRVGKPDDIARVVAYLVSDEAAYMTGQSINVTGGLWLS
jgi:NAD(P)-dependent dehydrogenase (short-subunit alcohol dehydrogenase family)